MGELDSMKEAHQKLEQKMEDSQSKMEKKMDEKFEQLHGVLHQISQEIKTFQQHESQPSSMKNQVKISEPAKNDFPEEQETPNETSDILEEDDNGLKENESENGDEEYEE